MILYNRNLHVLKFKYDFEKEILSISKSIENHKIWIRVKNHINYIPFLCRKLRYALITSISCEIPSIYFSKSYMILRYIYILISRWNILKVIREKNKKTNMYLTLTELNNMFWFKNLSLLRSKPNTLEH